MLETSFLLGAADLAETAGGLATKFQVQWPYFFAQVVNFLLVAVLLYKFAFKPVLAILDERQRKISDGLQYAEEMKHKLADAEKKHNEMLKEANQQAQQTLDEAREHAKRLMEKQTQEAVSRAESLLENARRSIELEREKMLTEVRQEVTALVVKTTATVLRKELSAEEIARYDEAAAKEIAGKN